jgi:hypothetical protein
MGRRKAKLDITLFPFLSVLSGLIAVNVLFMIVTISTRVSSPEPEPSALPGGEGTDDSEAVPDGIDTGSYEQLEKQIGEVEAALNARRAARNEIRLRLRELEAMIRSKEIELTRSAEAARPKTGERFGEPTPLRIVPAKDSDGVVRKGVLVEVSANGFILHPEKKEYRVDPAKMNNDPLLFAPLLLIPEDFDKALAEMRTSADNRYPIFLVHPSGALTFRSVKHHIEQRHKPLRMGWEPFSREFLVAPDK